MRRFVTIGITVLATATAANAQTFMDQLRQTALGKGTVTVTQSKAIDDLINGSNKETVTAGNTTKTDGAKAPTTATHAKTDKPKATETAKKNSPAKAVIALEGEKFAGFSYIETWGNKEYVTTSGLIVHPDFRGRGVAKHIKDMTFTLARTRWPHAKIFSLTSGAAVMAMNTQLGYQPVTFADLTDDEAFWRGCEGCINVDVLKRTGRKYCICTAMLYDPEEHLPAKIPQDVLDRIKELDAPSV